MPYWSFAHAIYHFLLSSEGTDSQPAKFPESTPSVPSLECIRIQFWPANPYNESALHYTEQFNVKFGIQIC